MSWKSDNTQPGTWTDEAAARIAGSIGRALKALADDDNESFDAECAKAQQLMANPKNKHQ